VQVSKELLDVILLLTPGIISFYIIETLTHYKKVTYQRIVLNVIILNFIIYFGIYIFIKILNKISTHWADKLNLATEQILHKDINISIMILGLIFSIFLGFWLSKAINKKYIFRFANRLNISDLSSNLNVWDDFLSSNRTENVVVIRDKVNNLMYYGLIGSYSETTLEKKELHLFDVTVYGNIEANKLYDVEELYLIINDTMTIEVPHLNNKDEINETN